MYTPPESDQLQQQATALDGVYSAYQTIQFYITWNVIFWFTLTVVLPLYVLYKHAYLPFNSPLRKIPGQKYIPVIGNMKDFFSGESMDHALKLIKEYGSISRYYFFNGKARVLVADPDLIKYMLIKNAKNYIKPPDCLVLVKRILGNGLVLSEGKTHAVHKRLMSPAFNRSAASRMVPEFSRYANRFAEFWENKIVKSTGVDGSGGQAEIEVHSDFKRLTLDVVGKTAFGYEFNCIEDPDHELCVAFHRMLSGGFIDWKMMIPGYFHIPFKEVRQVTADKDLMKKTVQNIIENKRFLMKQNSGQEPVCNDVLGNMMLARDSLTGQGLSDTELYDQVITLMLAGHETTAVALVWLLYVLATEPEVQRKLREEISAHLPNRDSSVTDSMLSECSYLNAVIKETLRLYPPVPLTVRSTVNDDKLNAYDVPKNSVVLLAIGAMMRQPKYFEDPNVFKPERFLDPETSDKMAAFLPFLAGARVCLGYKFALAEMKTIIATLVRRFKFEMMPGLVIKKKMSVTMKPDPALELRVSLVNY